MEITLKYHKGADKKPKPPVLPPHLPVHSSPSTKLLTLIHSTIYLFREEELPIFCPISHIMVIALKDDAIRVDGCPDLSTSCADRR
jgi:hypothetical protein